MSLLAYVFWHWPKQEVSTMSYEEKLTAFLASLNDDRPSGMVQAFSFRVDQLPWGPQGGHLYEDWYILEGFSALEGLSDAAVSGATKSPHDSVARDYLKGTASIFRCISGDLPLGEERVVSWVDKTPGVPYPSFYDEIAGVVGDQQARLWRRQLVLGPSTQFCLRSTEQIQFPESLKVVNSKLQPLTNH
jgi:hypothetical protein